MTDLKNKMIKVLEIVCIALFAFITMVGTYQIVTRYVFNAPSTISEELLTYSFTWLALLATALVFGKRDHMRMSFVADKFKGKTAVIMGIVSEVFTMVFAGVVLVYGGIVITKLTMTQVTASLGIPMGLVYIILPICGVLTMVFNIVNISQLTKELK